MRILEILQQYNIEYVEYGPNVKQGNVNIACPLCGDDPSHHMGVEPLKGYYGCWRNSKHRGKNFAKILRILIGCSFDEAERLLGGTPVLEENEFDALAKNLFVETATEEVVKGVDNLVLPSQFKLIDKKGFGIRFWEYLYSRGFGTDVDQLIKQYNLLYCLTGEWKYRLILPIYSKNKLITWIGRSIVPSMLPYKDLSVEKSVQPPKHCLFNIDKFRQGGEILYITEGFFDALKLDFYLPPSQYATCLFTKSITDEQVSLLLKLSSHFDEIRILLDEEAYSQALEIASELHFIGNVRAVTLPEDVADPGDLTPQQIQQFF